MDKSKPLRKENFDSRELGDEWILINLDTDEIHILNDLAGYIWNMCDGGHNIEEMEQLIFDEYMIPEGMNVNADVQNVLQSFVERDMLVMRET